MTNQTTVLFTAVSFNHIVLACCVHLASKSHVLNSQTRSYEVLYSKVCFQFLSTKAKIHNDFHIVLHKFPHAKALTYVYNITLRALSLFCPLPSAIYLFMCVIWCIKFFSVLKHYETVHKPNLLLPSFVQQKLFECLAEHVM